MRVAIVHDMEGVSHIESVREVFPSFQDYWHTGRAKLTADLAAAAVGLLEGGASEVVLVNHHGLGEPEWPNVVEEAVPTGVRVSGWSLLDTLASEVDVMLQVGAHARGGHPSFLSHTSGVGVRWRANGELLSESHLWAWDTGVPVIGIVGSSGLGATLGSLADVPFLAVQTSQDRASAKPVHQDPVQTAGAIRRFAKAVVSEARDQASRTPDRVVLEASIRNADDAAPALEGAGWTRRSRTEFRVGPAPWKDLAGAFEAAGEAAWEPYAFSVDGFDPRSEATSMSVPSHRLSASRAWLESWAHEETAEWITPEVAARWDGVGIPPD